MNDLCPLEKKSRYVEFVALAGRKALYLRFTIYCRRRRVASALENLYRTMVGSTPSRYGHLARLVSTGRAYAFVCR